MSYKNANIKSKLELAQRLVNGETLYADNGRSRIYFDEKEPYPFRYNGSDCLGVWTNLEKIQIKTDWRDEVSEENPVLCWVWDDVSEKFIQQVSDINNSNICPYETKQEEAWSNAEPVKPEDLYHE